MLTQRHRKKETLQNQKVKGKFTTPKQRKLK
jgi:hypothetical protein